MPNLSSLLEPKSIAIIGASPDTSIIRGKVQKMLQDRRYTGRIYPVSRRHTEVQGVPAVASIQDLPQGVDMAIIAIPAKDVPQAIIDCGQIGVRAAYIISSGFAEEGAGEGARLQEQLKELAARFDMAICGPNGEGIYNGPDNVVANFSPAFSDLSQALMPETTYGKRISISSQSGGIGFSYFHRGRPRQLRFNHIVSTGNEAVIDSFDFADWFLDDRADVLMMYLEGIRNAETFRRAAEKAADLGKPMVIAKMGRSDVGARAVASHTAALAGSDAITDAMFRHYGITRAYDIDQQIDIATAFAFCKLPKGNRVAVLAGSGGSGVWMADTLAVHGLEVPVLDDETREQIDKIIPSYGSSRNPIDLTAEAVHKVGYAHVLEILQKSKSVDAIVVVGSLAYTHVLKRNAAEFERIIRDYSKPTVFCTFTRTPQEAFDIGGLVGMPIYTSMPNCAVAMRSLVEYAEFQARRSKFMAVPTTPYETRQSVNRKIDASGSVIGEHEAKKLLIEYGIDCPPESVARSAEAASAAAESLGYPVALKINAPGLAHKTEIGGVVLNLKDKSAVEAAFATITAKAAQAAPGLATDGVLVQGMAPRGVEIVIGASKDPVFGPMLMVGFGGILVEVLRDVAFTPVPITSDDAHHLLKKLRGYSLLEGVRGAPPADIDALCRLVAKVSEFVADTADLVREVDLNPVIVHERGRGLTVIDALIVKSSETE